MKKRFIHFLVFLLIHLNVLPDIEPVPEGYTQLNCELKPSPNKSRHAIRPSIKSKTGKARNWAGYASFIEDATLAEKSVTAVAGSWEVPTITGNEENLYSEIWIGIDGFNNHHVEQIGTSHNWIDGKQENIAWLEMYPEDPILIPNFPLSIGDTMTASIEYDSTNDSFNMKLINHTQKLFVNIKNIKIKHDKAQRNSAEWIVEAPSIDNILPLANFGTINLKNCKTIINNVTGPINGKEWSHEAIIMIDNDQIKAIPTKLSRSGYKFDVIWEKQN